MPKMELVLGLSESRRWPTRIALRIDTGSPWMNRAVHGFLNVGAVAACKAAAEDTSDYLISRGGTSEHKLEHAMKKMCKEGAYWGAAAGVYEAVEYGVERIRGRTDWTNAMIGGALTGVLVSAVTVVAVAGGGTDDYNNYRGKVIIKGAITGGAVATAAELVSQRRRVAPAAPAMTFFGRGISGDGSISAIRCWEWRRHDGIVDEEEGVWVEARGLELEVPSSE